MEPNDLPAGPIGDALESAASTWIAANTELAQRLTVQYSTSGNPFLHEAETAHSRAERGAEADPTADQALVSAATEWVRRYPRDSLEPHSTFDNRFLWAAEAAFFNQLSAIEPPASEPRPKSASPKAGRRKATIPNDLRWTVWERDNFTCLHCGVRRDLTIDHVYPEALGGSTNLENLQTLCRSCNSRKGTRVEGD